MTRRQFSALVAAAAATLASGRAARAIAGELANATPTATESDGKVMDAGPVDAFDHDGVYDALRDQGCFVIRRDDRLTALSSVCTHKGCKVRAQADGSFYCKCHGSRFDPEGRVTKGPATKDLPRLAVALDGRQHVMVDVGRKIGPVSA